MNSLVTRKALKVFACRSHNAAAGASILKCYCSMLVVLLLALHAAAQTPEMIKWLADLDAQWQATFKREVSDAHAAELDKLKAQYPAWVQSAMTKAAGAGDLDGGIALRNEQKRFSEANEVPAQDAAADPFPLKQLRGEWRAEIARMEKDRAARANALQSKYAGADRVGPAPASRRCPSREGQAR